MNTRSLAIAALVAGVGIAILSSIPFVNLLNCLLCGWVWLGGIFSVYLYQRNEPGVRLVKPEQGALLGALAGIVGGIIGGILGAIIGTASNATALSIIQNNPQLQEQFGEYLPMLVAQGGFSLFGTLCSSVIYAAFGAIGGLIGAVVIKPKAPPAM